MLFKFRIQHKGKSEFDGDYIASDEEDDDGYFDENEEDECTYWTTILSLETLGEFNAYIGAEATNTPKTATDFQDEAHEDSDHLHTPPESEDEELVNKFSSFKMGDGKRFVVDMKFTNKVQVKSMQWRIRKMFTSRKMITKDSL